MAHAPRQAQTPGLAASERHQLLWEWNREEHEPAAAPLVPAAIARQVREHPDRVALVDGEERITYRELDRRSAALSARLALAGAGPEVVVVLALPRSAAAAIAILALWRMGAAYLPIDPEQAAERVAQVLADALDNGPRLVLTDGASSLPAGRGLTYIDVHAEPTHRPRRPPGLPQPLPEAVAYLLYTSGSTGLPKGIAVSHRALAARVAWAAEREFAGEERVLHKTTLTFDVSVIEIFGPLAAGARCILVPQGEQRDLGRVAALIARQRVSYASFPPSALDALLAQPGAERDLASLRLLVTGGETVDPRLPARVRAALPAAALFNRYGPTETTISVITGRCPPRGEGRVPLGRAIAGARLYVLNGEGLLAAFLAPGELSIGGPCLARGYRGKPGATAAAFLPDPWSGGAGERLYRSGDRVRWLPDGSLEFLGRVDLQVKVRGFRVEPAEVEAALASLPAVREAAVLAERDEELACCELAAFVVPVPGLAASEATLRRALGQRLDPYMIPARITLVSALPRTLSGKVDRRALAGRSRGMGAAPPPSRLPTALEARLARTFASVLGRPSLGPEDDLFELGAHSLHLVRLQRQLAFEHGFEVALADLALYPTAASLARLLGEGAAGGEIQPLELAAEVGPLPPLPRAPRERPGDEPLSRVLVTGATGFLGAHLVAELLATTSAEVLCLVRVNGHGQGGDPLRRSFARYGLDAGSGEGRLHRVAGDLALPGLGLDADAFRGLSERVDSIFHLGANVNLAYPYELLRPVNVEGTREVLRLAATGAVKTVHYVSTLSVLEAEPFASRGSASEIPLPAASPGLAGGYRQSKWVAERMVAEAGRAGLPVVIYRPGWITGNSRTGRANLSDLLSRLVLASLLARLAPDLGEARTCPTAVDFVGAALVRLAGHRSSIGRVFHLINPEPVAVRDLVAAARDLGYPLQVVPAASWAAALAERLEAGALPELLPLVPFLRRVQSAQPEAASSWQPMRFASTAARWVLDAEGLRCPAADGELLRRYLRGLAEQWVGEGRCA